MKHWIIEHAGGTLGYAKTGGTDPAAEGVDLGLRHADTGREGAADEAWNWVTSAWEPMLDAIEARLLVQIDRERVRHGSEVLTAGEPVLLGYTRKAAEVADYRSLSSEDLAALDVTARRARFPWLMTEADTSSSPLADVVDRVATAMNSSEFRLRTIDALAVTAKAAVRAAGSAEGKRAAANIDWGTA